MVRLGSVALTYFIIGVLMYGAGIVGWEDAGIASYFFSDPGAATVDSGVVADLEQMGGSIGAVGTAVVGPILAIWGFVTGILGFLAWPVGVLAGQGAPGSVTMLMGGTLVAAFVFGVVDTIKQAS